MTTETIKVDPPTVLFFALTSIRGGVADMEAAIEAQDVTKLTEVIDKLVSATTTAAKAIEKGALR